MKRLMISSLFLILGLNLTASYSKIFNEGKNCSKPKKHILKSNRGEIIGDTLYIYQEDQNWFTYVDLENPDDTIYISVNLTAQNGSYIKLFGNTKIVFIDSNMSNLHIIPSNQSYVEFRRNVTYNIPSDSTFQVLTGGSFKIGKNCIIQ